MFRLSVSPPPRLDHAPPPRRRPRRSPRPARGRGGAGKHEGEGRVGVWVCVGGWGTQGSTPQSLQGVSPISGE